MTETETTVEPALPAAGTQPTQYEKLRAIPWSLAYDLANTFFVQLTFFGSVFILFLDELGLNESQIGLLLSIMPFLSLLSLFITLPVHHNPGRPARRSILHHRTAPQRLQHHTVQ
jgi:hypothetical protein